MPKTISIVDWLGTGRVAGIKPGDTSELLLRTLGPLGKPPMIGPKENRPLPGCWLYGEQIEFGLDKAGLITYIQADTCRIDSATPDPDDALALNWMGLYHNMPLGKCQRWLSQHKLTRHYADEDNDGGAITVEGETQLHFIDPCDGGEPLLVTVMTSRLDLQR